MLPLRRVTKHASHSFKRFYNSKPNIQSVNTHERSSAINLLKKQRDNRKELGINIHALSKIRDPSTNKFMKYRKQINHCKTKNEIDRILRSRNDFDISVYTAAIKQSGILHDIRYCMRIAHMALKEQKLTPTHYLYGTLFNAFNLNLSPLYCDKYLDEMINVYHVIPNTVIVTTLLAGCSKTGNMERAIKIWDIMLKCNMEPNHAAYNCMIVTCGQYGDWKEAKRYYDEMQTVGLEQNVATHGAMVHAYIKNNQIEDALLMKQMLENAGTMLTMSGYIPLISYYLRDAEHQDPVEALKLLKECMINNNMTQLNDVLMSIKYVALLKALQSESDKKERKKYFKLIKNAPKERVLNGLKEWSYSCASVVHGAYLEYYENDFERTEVIECFEKLCAMNMMGIWFYDKKMLRWMIDLHGYSYQQLDFVLYYLLNIKGETLVETMGYTWIFICGKRLSASPDSKDRQSGARKYIEDKLWHDFSIKTSDVEDNPGRILLNIKHIKRYIEKRKKAKQE